MEIRNRAETKDKGEQTGEVRNSLEALWLFLAEEFPKYLSDIQGTSSPEMEGAENRRWDLGPRGIGSVTVGMRQAGPANTEKYYRRKTRDALNSWRCL